MSIGILIKQKLIKNIELTSWTNTNNIEDNIKLFTNLIINTVSDVFELTSYSERYLQSLGR